MSIDLFQELAESEIPPPPEDLERPLHERVNRWLLSAQILELVWRAMPWAAMTFSRALVGWFVFSLTGNFPKISKRR